MSGFKHNVDHLAVNGKNFISTIPLKGVHKKLFSKTSNINYGNGAGSSGDNSPDIYFIMLWGQSNNTSRYTISGNLPAGQQGAQTGIKNWAYNSGTPQFQTYESGVNDSYGTTLVINGASANYENQAGKFGIGNSLAYKLYNTYNKPCYMVQQAVGGTGLDSSFTPLTWDCNTSNNLYAQALSASIDAMTACQAANPGLIIKPVLLWIQGESDAYTSQATADAYEANLTAFINKSRVDLAAANTIFTNVDWVVTSLRADTTSYPWRDTVQRAQVAIASTLDQVYLHYMNTPLTPISSDHEHYTPITASFAGQLAAVNAGYDLATAFNMLYATVDIGYMQYLGGYTIATVGDYKYMQWDTHGVLTVINTGGKNLDNYMGVAGGASGGNGSGYGGGGGAGGKYIDGTNYNIGVSKSPIYIGYGGAVASSTDDPGNIGLDTVFFGTTLKGGGFGGGHDSAANGGSIVGGNGGGGSGNFPTAGTGGTGTKNGGNGVDFASGGSGGGGASTASNGSNGSGFTAGAGADGTQWVDGNYYGAGGGGAARIGGTRGLGGLGGGGNGQERSSTNYATSGTNGTGGGGGGVIDLSAPQVLTTGGDGLVKIRVKFQN